MYFEIVAIVVIVLLLALVGALFLFTWRKESREATFLKNEASQQLSTESIDLKKYYGKWFEVARLPNEFESKCSSATAEYIPIDGNSFKVVNTCYDAAGKLVDVGEGVARLNENAGSYKDRWAKVAFFGLGFPNVVSQVFEGDYLILNVVTDPNQQTYSDAIVGSIDKSYLWILSRSEISGERLQQLVDIAASKGYDTSKLIIGK